MNDDENLIHVLNKTLALYQAPEGFRTSMDSVMLAASCPANPGDAILDLGCGVGSAGLCTLKRIENTTLTGADIQQDHIDLARKNAAINALENRAEFLCSDIKNLRLGNKFDHIICNPPYMKAGAHIHSPSHAKARAMGHIEEDASLKDWVSCAHRHIKGQGSLTIIHDAGETDNIIQELYNAQGNKRFGATKIIPIFPKQSQTAKRVIIRTYKHKQSPATILPGIIMHKENGDYTKEAEHVLRNAGRLF